MNRRDLLKSICCGAAGLSAYRGLAPLRRALAADAGTEFLLTVYVSGGWDVLSWAAPITTASEAVDPVTTANTNYTDTNRYPQVRMRLWKDGADVAGGRTYEPVLARGVPFGPAIGDMLDHFDGWTLFGGLATSTVAHPDGTAFCLTGQHLRGGTFGTSTVDAIVASESGLDRPMPAVALTFPARVVGTRLDPRAVPITVGGIGSVAQSLSRHERFTTKDDQKAVDALLLEEAKTLQAEVAIPGAASAFAAQVQAVAGLKTWGPGGGNAFDAAYLSKKYLYRADQEAASGLRRLDGSVFTSYFLGADPAINLAFAAEAFSTNLSRCVSIGVGAFDDHARDGYARHAMKIERTMNALAGFLAIAKALPHPTLPSHKLFEHLHVIVVSEFCRSPRLNALGGRDHHPNNAAIVVSPSFRPGRVVGGFDERVEPAMPTMIAAPTGPRAIHQGDLVATLLAGMKVPAGLGPRDSFVITDALA